MTKKWPSTVPRSLRLSVLMAICGAGLIAYSNIGARAVDRASRASALGDSVAATSAEIGRGEQGLRSPSQKPQPDEKLAHLEFAGIDLDAVGMWWFALVLVLLLAGRSDDLRVRQRFGGYSYALGVIGVAAVFGSFYRVSFDLHAVGVARALSAVCVFAILVAASTSASISAAFSRDFLRDVWHAARRPLSWLVVGASGVVVAVMASRVGTAAPRPGPMGAAFVEWYSSRPRTPVNPGESRIAVSVTIFTDYQCAACRTADRYYRPLFDRLKRDYPNDVVFRTMDYPIDAKCNKYTSRANHPLSCDAAVVMNLAQKRGTNAAMCDWLWVHQDSLTATDLFAAAGYVAGIEHLEREYAAAMEAVRADIEIAHAAGVHATPTLNINGVSMGFVPSRNVEAVVFYELRRAGIRLKGAS